MSQCQMIRCLHWECEDHGFNFQCRCYICITTSAERPDWCLCFARMRKEGTEGISQPLGAGYLARGARVNSICQAQECRRRQRWLGAHPLGILALLWHMPLAGELARELWAACPKMAVEDGSLAALGRPSLHSPGPGAPPMQPHCKN